MGIVVIMFAEIWLCKPSFPRGPRPGEPFGERPGEPFGERPGEPFGERPGEPFGERPGEPFGERLYLKLQTVAVCDPSTSIFSNMRAPVPF